MRSTRLPGELALSWLFALVFERAFGIWHLAAARGGYAQVPGGLGLRAHGAVVGRCGCLVPKMADEASPLDSKAALWTQHFFKARRCLLLTEQGCY